MGTIYKSGIPYSGGGSSLPDGGTTGQALVKKSNTNQDVEWKNVGSGGGAEFSIDSASNSGVLGQGNDYFNVNLNGEDTVDLSLVQPNAYSRTKTVPTKEYVDSKATVIVGSDWGVAKVGAANIPVSYDEIAEVIVDISDMGFKSSDDFKIAITGMADYIFCVPSINTTSFKIRRVGASTSSNTWVHYTIFAKGYGSTPKGGTTGQVLTKKSNANGDVEWANGGSGTGNAEFDITPEHNIAMTSANGEHLIFNFTEMDTLEARASIPGSYEKRKILATKDYVDSQGLQDVLANGATATDETATFNNKEDESTGLIQDAVVAKTQDDKYVTVIRPDGFSINYDDPVINPQDPTDVRDRYFKIYNMGSDIYISRAGMQFGEHDNFDIFLGADHVNISGYRDTDPQAPEALNHFSMEWGEVAYVDMSDDLKTAWRGALDIIDGGESYSTDEQTVGTWVDGKTIYQKTMTCAMPTDIVDGTIKNTFVPHGVSNIAQIVGCESVSKATSGNVGGEDGNMSVGNMFTHISADSYQINLSANIAEYSGKEYFVTFRYTKTT